MLPGEKILRVQMDTHRWGDDDVVGACEMCVVKEPLEER